jgi:acyl dehydratase
MTLEFLTDVEFPVVTRRIVADKVADYVDVTGDDHDRWSAAAPPSYAGALLFVAAPLLLEHPDVAPFTKVLVHLDQTFRWHAPLAVGEEVTVGGRVERVRSRGGVWFVTFAIEVSGPGGRLIDSVSTFLLGDEAAGDLPTPRSEPPVRQAARSELPVRYDVDRGVPDLVKSASRHDLVRYAAAAGDFNPIHFDHEAALGAGLAGIVCHGLLTTAWVTQLAAAATDHPVPLAELTVRYRDPVYPAETVAVAGEPREPDDGVRRLDVTVTAADRTSITGRVMVRERA